MVAGGQILTTPSRSVLCECDSLSLFLLFSEAEPSGAVRGAESTGDLELAVIWASISSKLLCAYIYTDVGMWVSGCVCLCVWKKNSERMGMKTREREKGKKKMKEHINQFTS